MVRIVLGVFALLLSLVAGWMVNVYLTNKEERLAEWAASQKPAPVPTSEVLVAASNIEIGSVASSRDFRWQSWPDDGINAHYIVRKNRPDALDKLAGAAARQTITEGEPVIEDKLITPKDGGFLAAVLPRNGRALTLKVDEASGVAGLLLPGDRVDVILTHDVPVRENDGLGGVVTSKRFVSETIVKDVPVLAIDQEFKHDDKGNKLGKTVTLSVTQPQAEAVALGRVMGTLTLSLRSAFGNPVADTRAQQFTSSTDISGALRALSVPPPVTGNAIFPVTIFRGLNSENVLVAR